MGRFSRFLCFSDKFQGTGGGVKSVQRHSSLAKWPFLCRFFMTTMTTTMTTMTTFKSTFGSLKSILVGGRMYRGTAAFQNGLFCADFWLAREMSTWGTHGPFAQAQEQVCLFMPLMTVLNANMQLKHSLYISLSKCHCLLSPGSIMCKIHDTV